MRVRKGLIASAAVGLVLPATAALLWAESCSLAGIASGGTGGASTSASSGPSSSSGSSQSGGAGAAAGTGASGGGSPSCPADMVLIPASSELSIPAFCIEAIEVTNDAYQAFLDGGPDAHDQGPKCIGWNVTFEPAVVPSSAPPKNPVLGVNWCDAVAYCKSKNRHLCGKVGGGSVNFWSNNDSSEWYRACTNRGVTDYPYGQTVDAGLCNDCDETGGCDASVKRGPDAAVAAGTTFPRCVNATDAGRIFDMSGNAWEWEDSCDESGDGDPEEDKCVKRGGSFDVPFTGDGGKVKIDCLACAFCTSSAAGGALRKQKAIDTGLRCCSEP